MVTRQSPTMSTSTSPRPLSDKERDLVRKAMAAWAVKDLQTCERLALRLFRYAGFRRVQVGDQSISTWYDQRSHNWVTQVLDADRGQVGNADFSGWTGSAAVAHLSAIHDLLVSTP